MTWNETDTSLETTRKFEDFEEAMEFVNEVAELAEEHGHHPDIYISYNVVELELTTHDAGSVVTEKDRALAEEIDKLL